MATEEEELRLVAASFHEPHMSDSPVKHRLETEEVRHHSAAELLAREAAAAERRAAILDHISSEGHREVAHAKEVAKQQAVLESWGQESTRAESIEKMEAAAMRRDQILEAVAQHAHQDVEHSFEVYNTNLLIEEGTQDLLLAESEAKQLAAELRRRDHLSHVAGKAAHDSEHAHQVLLAHRAAQCAASLDLKQASEAKMHEAEQRRQDQLHLVAGKAHEEVVRARSVAEMAHLSSEMAQFSLSSTDPQSE